MNPSPSLNRAAAAESPPICHAQWTPDTAILEAFSGDEESIAELIDAFRTDTESRLRRIRAALAIADVAGIRREAHAIRGSAGQICAETLAEVCMQVEMASASTPLPHFFTLVLRMQELFGEVSGDMAAYRSHHV